MEDKKKKAADPADDITWGKKANCINHPALPDTTHPVPTDYMEGYAVRPGFYEISEATAASGGVNSTAYPYGATDIELLLFRRTEEEPYVVLPFPKHYRIGNMYSIVVFRLDIGGFEYVRRVDGPYKPKKGLIFDETRYLLDPYAEAVTGQNRWEEPLLRCQHCKVRVVRDDFDWVDMTQPLTPMEDLIIHELCVRGFTIHGSLVVFRPGTFEGLVEELPYLLELGVNAVGLMPIFEFDEMQSYRKADGRKLYSYRGYNTVGFFSSNTSYAAGAEYNREGSEPKNLVQVFSQHGIEVYLGVMFNHTAEGNENGPLLSSEGFSNNIYYLLTPEGYCHNFSGYSNTLNCNHPIAQQTILNCLCHWITTYRVDGFCFGLASVMGYNEGGTPMNKPPLLQNLVFGPALGDVKLIAKAWDVDNLYQVETFPSWDRWAEWNDGHRGDMRRHTKGGQGMTQAVALRIVGPRDICVDHDRKNTSANFITCHDGFTPYDLFSYNVKHNESSRWNNANSANDNNSWNYGTEGETDGPQVGALRRYMVRNACVFLMCSRRIPIFLAGNEFCSAQFGNNNAYCQDNKIS